MTAASPTAMSSFRPRYRAVERQERAHEREWRSQSEPAQNKIFISMNGASQVASIQGQALQESRTDSSMRCLSLGGQSPSCDVKSFTLLRTRRC